jgi:hypothetical protein
MFCSFHTTTLSLIIKSSQEFDRKCLDYLSNLSPSIPIKKLDSLSCLIVIATSYEVVVTRSRETSKTLSVIIVRFVPPDGSCTFIWGDPTIEECRKEKEMNTMVPSTSEQAPSSDIIITQWPEVRRHPLTIKIGIHTWDCVTVSASLTMRGVP